ncbi:MAG TPA: DUF2487 family protein [Bacillota bacterium]|nr:DUF2487 family protein [Bacillota bacterium]
MKWTKANLETFIETKEYIDTLLIPLVKLDLTNDQQMKASALEREYIEVLSYELERRLAGRLMLLPTYSYVNHSSYTDEMKRLNEWITSFYEQSFDKAFIISLDSEWNKYSDELNGQFLWLSHVPFDHIHDDSAKSFIKTQADKLSEMIQTFWS